jgi:hypothetical protein
MPSSLHSSRQIMRMPDQKLAVLATILLLCSFCAMDSASAQSQKTHYRSYSSTHYSAATHVHSFNQKPHSAPSSFAPEVLGKSSAGAVMSRDKELDRLEHASVVKSMSVKSEARSLPTKNAFAPNTHSAPINFSHKELPQSSATAQRRPSKR